MFAGRAYSYTLLPLISDLTQGLFESVEPIAVIKHNFENSQYSYIALEGNRRLASKKILCSQELSSKYGVEFNLKHNTETPIYVFDSRTDAEIYLQRRHVAKAESWETLPKIKFFYNSYIESNGSSEIFDVAKITALSKKYQMSVTQAKTSLINYIVFKILILNKYFDINNLKSLNIESSLLTTALSNPLIRSYISLEKDLNVYDQTPLDTIEKSIRIDKLLILMMIIYSKSHGKNGNSTLLIESRNISKLAKILEHQKAIDRLFEIKDIERTHSEIKIIIIMDNQLFPLDFGQEEKSKNPNIRQPNPTQPIVQKPPENPTTISPRSKIVSTQKANILRKYLDTLINSTEHNEAKDIAERMILELVKISNKI